MSRINWDASGVTITDEVQNRGSAAYQLAHDAWKNLEIWTGAGKTGTQLVEDTDYQLDAARTLTNAFGESATVHTQVQIINATYEDTDLYHTYDAVADFQKAITAKLQAASVPAHYRRSERWKVKGDTGSDRLTLVSPSELTVNIDGVGYLLDGSQEIRLSDTASWDDLTGTDWTASTNRAGKDFYIYAVEPSDYGYVPGLILSANSTVPDGYTASTSRKIGGFHCLCTDVGTNTYGYVNSTDDIELVDEAFVSHSITGTQHWLEGWVQGDILPFSVWDFEHRPVSDPEGMVYDPGSDMWVDIYLASEASGILESVHGATTADGDNGWHQYRFSQMFGRQKKLLPRQDEFVSFSLGSPQGVKISGGSDPGTTGGHTATDGKRIVSLIGVEDATGVLWQWGREAGATNDVGSSYSNAYDGNDVNVAGKHYEAPNRPLFGGHWGAGSNCGSRGSHWSDPALALHAMRGGRGVAEPLGRRS